MKRIDRMMDEKEGGMNGIMTYLAGCIAHGAAALATGAGNTS
jgi:hypothetical protein